MWRGINGGGANMSKTEKVLNKVSDVASGAVDTAGSADGVFGFVKTIAANEEVRAIGKTILEGVPAIMGALETLTEVHPFLKAAYLPFKLIYHQETQRRANDQKRSTLFEKIKDVMLVLLELKAFKPDDTRLTPEGKPILSRLADICKEMKKDIEECYNALNAQDKHSVAIKFLKASSWNAVLAGYGSRFETRRGELSFTLQMRTAVTVEEMNNNMKTLMQMFSSIRSPQERDIGRWIKENGGEKAVLASDSKCAEMIKYEASISRDDPRSRMKPELDQSDELKTVTALRKSYRDDIQVAIQGNFKGFSKRFEMGMDDINKDLTKKISHQGDRIIKYLQGGPQSRIKDKIIYHIWKDQGWKGSAKTRTLVLALRDYFVERVERSSMPARQRMSFKPPKSTHEDEHDDDDDPEANIDAPLPDSWMTAYLQVKRLRYVQQSLDPDVSGLTTITEINNFTYARPEDWSVPRWISYWAIGHQIFATKYCIEIEELYRQMTLLNTEIGIRMTGNKRYVNDYIEGTWQHVTALTNSLERYDTPAAWLTDKFASYVEALEKDLEGRLEKIQYDIDALETVNLILGRTPIEQSIFMLLALLLRRHVAKMHLCLEQELDSRELNDDMTTVTWVVLAVWQRFLELKDFFLHQQVDLQQTFDWLSCGLFKNYYNWGDFLKPLFFITNDNTAWSAVNTIQELDKSKLANILVYGSASEGSHLPSRPEELSRVPSSFATPPSVAEMSIAGDWYGYHWTEKKNPCWPMHHISLKFGERDAESDTKSTISGSGTSFNDLTWTLDGHLDSADESDGNLSATFKCVYQDGLWVEYKGTFSPERGTLSGTFESSITTTRAPTTIMELFLGILGVGNTEGSFLFKKVPSPRIMCVRPLTPVLDAKELWSFACNAVLDDIRRKRPTSVYLCERFSRIRRALQLTYKDDLKTLTEEEAEYSQIHRNFTFEEFAEVHKLYRWYDRSGSLQPLNYYTCDGCGSSIRKSRVVCLDCRNPDDPLRTVDFCSLPECIASETVQREDVTHLPSHVMLKTRDLLLLKDRYSVYATARASLTNAQAVYVDPTKEEIPPTVPLPPSPLASDLGLPDADEATSEGVASSQPLPLEVPTENSEAPTEKPVTSGPDSVDSAPEPDSSPEEEAPEKDTADDEGDAEEAEAEDGEGEDEDEAEAEETHDNLKCVICQVRVSTPCWYCIDCNFGFVCDSCETAIDGLEPWDFQKRYRLEATTPHTEDESALHDVFHRLVRVARATESAGDDEVEAPAVDPEPSSAGKMEELEQRIESLTTRFEAAQTQVDKRLEEVESRLTTGFANIERLLQSIVENQVRR
ncbi:hypothetical protein C8J57DRAFT_1354883 [Mycena rebaudengoi]|nr:hypothetical protein C8J57DRAFT_1354883 [Mycena rebaudengoi]